MLESRNSEPAVALVAGRLADLTGTSTVAVPAGSWRLGQTASPWLGDSAPVHLRVVAVLADQIDTEQTVLLPWALREAHTAWPRSLRRCGWSFPGCHSAGSRLPAW